MLPEIKTLQERFSYRPHSGKFYWRVSPNRRIPAGSEAGGKAANGYLYLAAGGSKYLAARVAWAFMTGAWPEGQVDHVNRDKTDNRWSNLRTASVSENGANSRVRSHCKTGFKGVRATKSGKFYAIINWRGSQRYLGVFPTPEDANTAYLTAARSLYGDFAHGGQK